jgi:hypothetical protein
VNFTWGIGTHSNKQGGAILPEMLRWLWRDYARPDDLGNAERGLRNAKRGSGSPIIRLPLGSLILRQPLVPGAAASVPGTAAPVRNAAASAA